MKKMMTAAVLAAAALAGVANAGFTITAAGPIASNGSTPVNATTGAGNGVVTFNYAGPAFRAGNIVFNGLATKVNSGTFGSELRLRIYNPIGQFLDYGAFGSPGNSTWTTFNAVNITRAAASPFSNAANSIGTWTARFYESFDDGGTASVDANWTNISLDIQDFTPPPPPGFIEDLGDNSTFGGIVTRSRALAAGQVDWFKFNVSSAQSFFDIWTGGIAANGTSNLDTEIAVYNSDGEVVATNDDISTSGPNAFLSRLGFGAGSQINVGGATLGATSPGTATATALGAGTYYLAIGGFNTAFNNGFAVTGGTAAGSYNVNLIPSPSALAVLGLGGLVVGRRRR
jgi:MYXO-CTERM domain-containing protein